MRQYEEQIQYSTRGTEEERQRGIKAERNTDREEERQGGRKSERKKDREE